MEEKPLMKADHDCIRNCTRCRGQYSIYNQGNSAKSRGKNMKNILRTKISFCVRIIWKIWRR